MPSRAEIAQLIADAALPMAELQLEDAATVAVQDAAQVTQSQLLKRPIALQGIDLELARAIASLRLTHDSAALEELRSSSHCVTHSIWYG